MRASSPPKKLQVADEFDPADKPDLYLGARVNAQRDPSGRVILRSVTLKKLGGFRWEYSIKLRRYCWRTKLPIFVRSNDPALQVRYEECGVLKVLAELNDIEYLKLVYWMQNLRRQLDLRKDVTIVASRIEKQMSKARLMHDRFVDWFLNNGLEVPSIDLSDSFSPRSQTKIDETRVAPVKYKQSHFREFEKLEKTMKQLPAAIDFCKAKGFSSPQGFLRQYRDMYLNVKKKMKG